MTVEAMSSLPFQAGSAVAAAAGRTALWVISVYMRQPLRNTALAALIGISALAGANALYKQAHHHPAPMFGSFATAPDVVKKAAPVMPAKKPVKLAEPVSDETTGSVEQTPRVFPTFGKEDVAGLQQKLQTLGMFNGTVDGIFGPRTAKAIKAFEASVGRSQKGVLTTDLVAMVRDAEVTPPAPILPHTPVVVTPQTSVAVAKTQLPPVTPIIQAAPVVAAEPLPAPAPLLPGTQKAASAPLPAVPAPTEDDTAQAAIQVATTEPEDAAPQAAPLAMVQPNAVPKRPVQTIAVRATQMPAPAAPAADDAQQMPQQLASAGDSDPSNDSDVVSSVQRGLNSLGFLHAKVNGVADEATAKAIRNFEVYFNYNVTGRVTRQLVDLLEQNGAVI